MERVGKYYGVRLKDAIKFAWLDATFAVERKIGKLHRNRIQRAASETGVAAAVKASESQDATTTITTGNATQEAPLGSIARGLGSVFDKKGAQEAMKG